MTRREEMVPISPAARANWLIGLFSGLDPHITLQNAEYQLDRVASKWAANLKRDPNVVQKEIEEILQENASAPWFGLTGEKFVNVLEVNLKLRERYGAP